MGIEKRKKLLSTFDLFGESLSGPDGPLERWEKSFRENIKRRRIELRKKLIAFGVKVPEEKDKEKK